MTTAREGSAKGGFLKGILTIWCPTTKHSWGLKAIQDFKEYSGEMWLALAILRANSIPSKTRRSIEHNRVAGFVSWLEQEQNDKITFFKSFYFLFFVLFERKEKGHEVV